MKMLAESSTNPVSFQLYYYCEKFYVKCFDMFICAPANQIFLSYLQASM